MKNAIIIILVLSLQTAIAQTYKVFKGDTINRVDAKGLKQGLWRKYYETDTLFSEGYYKNGKHSGKFNTFHRNGQQQSILNFRGLTEISDAQLYNDSAQLIAKGKYIDRNKDSIWTYFDGHGNKTSEEFYKNGLKEGSWKVFFSNGKIAQIETYKNGKKNGPYKKFFTDGAIRLEGTMVNDELEGKVTLFFSDGGIWQQGTYRAGDKQGKWLTRNRDGSVEKEEDFERGILKDLPPELRK